MGLCRPGIWLSASGAQHCTLGRKSSVRAVDWQVMSSQIAAAPGQYCIRDVTR